MFSILMTSLADLRSLLGLKGLTESKLRIPTGGRLASWLFRSVGEELKLRITVLLIQLVVRAGIEPEFRIPSPASRPRFLPHVCGRNLDSINVMHLSHIWIVLDPRQSSFKHSFLRLNV